MPVLVSVVKGKPHKNISQLRSNINNYFEGFQTILPGNFTLRLLDIHGDSLAKVTHNKTSTAQYENLLGIQYVEPQVVSSQFVQNLEKLPKDEVSFLSLPHHFFKSENDLEPLLLDYAVPLYDQDQRVGTLVVSLSAQQIDRILHNAVRLYKGKIIVAENNPDNKNRHGLLIYDEKNNLQVSQNRSAFFTLQQRLSPELFSSIIDNTSGIESQDGTLLYFSEMYPYPNRLISWVVATQIEEDILFAPFLINRLYIWSFAAIALIVTLILTGFAVRKISQPICQLASQLKTFADGKFDQRADKKQSIAEINALSESFNYMADTLVNAQAERDKAQIMLLQNNKLASIGQMAAGIGHEINNPLNNILSYSTLISRNIAKNAADLETKTLSNLQKDIDALRSETLRASDIIKGILNFARQMPPQLKPFSIQDWLEKSIALVQQTAKARHISINVDYINVTDDENQTYVGDQAQLQQVIINLLLNAIQASADNTEIKLEVSLTKEYLKIVIFDQGCGIKEENFNKIYDPFFSTKEEGEGSGLGLSISLGIIESHHGTLLIENRSSDETHEAIEGTIATLILPLQ